MFTLISSWWPLQSLCSAAMCSSGLANSNGALRWIVQWFILKGNVLFTVVHLFSDDAPIEWHSRLLPPFPFIYWGLYISNQRLVLPYSWTVCYFLWFPFSLEDRLCGCGRDHICNWLLGREVTFAFLRKKSVVNTFYEVSIMHFNTLWTHLRCTICG